MNATDIEFDKIKRCPACKSRNSEFLFYGVDVQFSKTMIPFPVSKCLDCSTIYLKERPSTGCISHFYPTDIYYINKSLPAKPGELQGLSLRARCKTLIKEKLKKREITFLSKLLLNLVPSHWRLAASYPPGSKVLDIGCSTGLQLDVYYEFGWITFGVDISQYAVEKAKAGGHNALRADIDDLNYSSNYFDAIQIRHVIEHLPDVELTLRKAHQFLKPDGLLLLETPNQKCLLARLFKADYWQIDSPRHFQLLNMSSLILLLNRCGFEINSIKTRNCRNGFINSVRALMARKYGNGAGINNNTVLRIINLLIYFISFPINRLALGENITIFAKKKME